MSDLERVAAEFRAAMLANDNRVAGELLTYFAGVWRQLKANADALTVQMEQARSAGEVVSPSWLVRQQRYKALIAQTEREVNVFARLADKRIVAAQREAVAAALADAPKLIDAALPGAAGIDMNWNHIPIEAMRDLVGTLQDGSPLRALLDELGPQASQDVRQALLDGLALGQAPAAIARAIQAALGGSAARALTIARTEILRSYRTSSLRTYQANANVVQGWIWSADFSGNICAVCAAEDGSKHTLDEQMETHLRCRCAMLPWTKSWAELGLPGVAESAPEIEPGPVKFARLSDKKQLSILGPGKYAAYKDGRITLADLVQHTHSQRWGGGRQEAPLGVALVRARRNA